jgi:hypothetical protein
MSTAIQRRRGSTTQHNTFTGLNGETTVDTDKRTVVVHDGVTAGGFPLARQNLSNVPNGTIGSSLLADDTVTFPKMQNIATARLLGRASAGTGDVEELASIPSGVDVPAARLSGTIATARLPGEAFITLGTSVNSTSGTAIDFTGIPAWAKRITIMFNGVSTNGTSSPMLQLGDSGGIETTGYAVTSATISATPGASAYTTGFTIRSGSSSAALLGHFVLTLLGSNNWVCSGNFGDTGTTTNYVVGGQKTLSDTLDRARITTVNGTDTFDAGSINIMYEG